MTRVGGPLIDIATMSEGEKQKFYKDTSRIKLAKGIYIRSRDWHELDHRGRALARIVATGSAAQGAIAAGKSAALIHRMPMKGWETDHPVEFAMYGATKPRARKAYTLRHLSLQQSVVAEIEDTRFGKVVVTPPAATGLDLARWHDLSTGVRGLDYALREDLATPKDIEAALRRGFGQHGVKLMRDAASLATAFSESPRESDMKVALWRAGLPAPYQQVNLYDHEGNFVARMDFFWPEIGFGTEYDGGGKFKGEFGIPVEIAAREDVIRQHKISNLGVLNYRVNNASARDASAMRGVVSMFGRVAQRGVPLDPSLWRCVGGRAW
ncbi:hypothetical protein [Corynebacterium sp.]|uniref:hypothetical protein n=1 Tax=Corynebacterium sp. TaxID=1720 RepID=UPI0026E01708|nr:hypothetical protein [Corynebacterium sp.]MDO5511699.1 hypothetical protein [Corynebacterium sp.]